MARMAFRIVHIAKTESTNRTAAAGSPGDVFWADEQTAGRGRLDHSWSSAPGLDLAFSAVIDVQGADPATAATLPLVAGLSVCDALSGICGGWSIKWPNDVLRGGRKACGILCERHGDAVIAGVGVNVNRTGFPPELSGRATSLRIETGRRHSVEDVLRRILDALDANVGLWREKGFPGLCPRVAEKDALRGRFVSVLQRDGDDRPVSGVCGGVLPDGSLDVGGVRVYAGEAHVAEAGMRTEAEP